MKGNIIMKEIKLFEEAIKNKVGNVGEIGINSTMFWAYRQSKEAGNELIDFHGVIWDNDIAEIVQTCRENNIREFTISSNFSSLIETLVEFEKFGCKMFGLMQVYAPYKDFMSDKQAVIPAIKMVL